MNNFDPTGHYLQPISGGARVADAGNTTATIGAMLMFVPGMQAVGGAMMVAGVTTATIDYAASGEADAAAKSIMSAIPGMGEAMMIGDTIETAQQIEEGNIGNEAEAIGQLTQMWAMTLATTAGSVAAGSRGGKAAAEEISFENKASDNIASESIQVQNAKLGIDFEAEINKQQASIDERSKRDALNINARHMSELYDRYEGDLTQEEFSSIIRDEANNLVSQQEYKDGFDIKAGLLEKYTNQRNASSAQFSKVARKYSPKMPVIEEAPEIMAEVKVRQDYNYEGVAYKLIENYESLLQKVSDKEFFGDPVRRAVADTFGAGDTALARNVIRNDVTNTIKSMKNNPEHAKYYEIFKHYNYDMR